MTDQPSNAALLAALKQALGKEPWTAADRDLNAKRVRHEGNTL